MFQKNMFLTMLLVGIFYTFFFYSNTAFCLELPRNIDWEQYRIKRDSPDTQRPAQRQTIDYRKKALKEAFNLNRKGNQAYRDGNWKEAVSYYQYALSKSPNDKVIRQNLINAQNALTKAQNAIAKKYAQKKDASKLNSQGNQAYKSKNWKKAIDYYEKALKKSPNDKAIKQNLAYSQNALNKEYIKKRDASKLNKQGNQAYRSKNWGKAIDYYKNALKKSPYNRVIKQNLAYAQSALAKEQRRKEKQRIEQKRKEKLAAEKRRKLKERQDKALNMMKRFATASAEVNLAVSTNADLDEAVEQRNSSFMEILNTDIIPLEEKIKHKLKLSVLNKTAVPPLYTPTKPPPLVHEDFFTENLNADQFAASDIRGLDNVFRLFKEVRERSEEQEKSETIDLLIGSIRNPRISTALKGGKIVSNKANEAIDNFMESTMKALGGHHDSKQFRKDSYHKLMQEGKKTKSWMWFGRVRK